MQPQPTINESYRQNCATCTTECTIKLLGPSSFHRNLTLDSIKYNELKHTQSMEQKSNSHSIMSFSCQILYTHKCGNIFLQAKISEFTNVRNLHIYTKIFAPFFPSKVYNINVPYLFLMILYTHTTQFLHSSLIQLTIQNRKSSSTYITNNC